MTTFIDCTTGLRYTARCCSNCRHSEPHVVAGRLAAGVKSCDRNTRQLGENPFAVPCGGWEREGMKQVELF